MPKFQSFVCAALLLALAPAAQAHARLLRSSPAKNAELAQAPGQIELWFNELLDEGFNSIAIFPAKELAAAKRTNLAKEKPIVDARDRTHLTLKVEPLAPGDYVLEWRVLSRDGHSAPGRFTFRILAR
jgi:methionine-rich copper-binding protein CopC